MPDGDCEPAARPVALWREVLLVTVVYWLYKVIRSLTEGSAQESFANARQVIRLEQLAGLYREPTLQALALDHTPVVVAANYFYGGAHMVVTAGTLVWLCQRRARDYRLWRNALVLTTGLALVGYWLFPLMPPRLLASMGDGTRFGYTDTLAVYPTFWSFQSPALSVVSNQFAAMPSLHSAWALWVGAVAFTQARRRWVRATAVGYAVTTFLVVIVTANHFFLDVAGAAVVLTLGYQLARAVTPLVERSARQVAGAGTVGAPRPGEQAAGHPIGVGGPLTGNQDTPVAA